jgi:hypothetical protein
MRTSLVLVGALAACDAGGAAVNATTVFAESPCTGGCGENGGVIDGVPFWGLYLSGAVNDDGVRYLRFARSAALMKAKVHATLDVDGGRLRFRTSATATWQGGAALTGGVLAIGIGAAEYYVKIAEVHPGPRGIGPEAEPYWTRTDEDRPETYLLQWGHIEDLDSAAQGPRELCATTVLDDDVWHNQIDAVVFEGEQYTLGTRKIVPTSTDATAWFNVACMGSLPAKMFLARRTDASSDGAQYVSTIDNDRQAMVRAWAADYCGSGQTYTHAGHKLRINDRMPSKTWPPGWLPRHQPIGFSLLDRFDPNFHYEAVWDAGGAVCLDLPRMSASDPKFDPDPGMLGKVHAECNPPPCTGQPWFPGDWAAHGAFITATLWP